jgi:uncharacterized protein YktA (UPF0223 family)
VILDLTVTRDQGKVTSPVSRYQPSKKAKARIAQAMEHFEVGREIMNTSYREFNDMTVLQRQSMDQASFNVYVEPQSTDPDESWKSQAVRPIVRNRTISIAAHVTGSLVYPQVYAQNDQDEGDSDSADVMRDLMEWAGEQANYVKTFLYATIGALVNPAVIVHTEFAESYRTVKEIVDEGKWEEKRVIDELFSGFQDTIVQIDELFIGDIRQPDIQKQPFIIWRRAIDFSAAQAKHGDKANFKKYVRPGIQSVFDADSGQFYDVEDENLHGRLVEEVIYYNRTEDLQLVILNGVLVTDPDQPNPRKDKRYPFAKTGYELIGDGQFFYYYSLVRKMSKDEEVINTLYRLVIDGTYLQLVPPMAIYGDEEINSSVITPGTMTVFAPETKMEAINIGSNLSAGMAALEKVEASASESSNDVLQSGQDAGSGNTAFEVSRLEQNARIMLGLFAKMIGMLVKDLGELRMSDILQFLTIADVNRLVSDGDRLTFQSFLIPDKNVEGKKKSRRIVFDDSINQDGVPPEERKTPLDLSFDVLKDEGGMDSDMEICRVVPNLFRERKFRVKVTPDAVTPPSDNVKRALNMEEYDRAIESPYANQEALYRDLLLGSYEATKSNADKYTVKPEDMQQQSAAQPDTTTKKPDVLAKVLGAGPNQELNKVAV